jgi:PAS domain S-box-containing protein
MATRSDPIDVLYIDDDPEFADIAALFLEREDDRLSVHTATGAAAGLDRLADGDIDCVVSDYDMPGTNGIELLERVRGTHPDLPFVLYTGKGSEAVASDAISAGVTDYLQKQTGTDQYALLANRITNAVEAARSARDVRRRRHRFEQILKTVPGCIIQLDADGRFVLANRRAEEVLGVERDTVTDRAYNDPEWDIRGENGDPIPDEDLPFRRVRDSGDPLYGYKHTIQWPDGTRKTLLVNGAPLFDDAGDVASVLFSLTDVTDERVQERELAETRRRLELALEATDTGVWEWDLDTDAVRWNETLERVMGFDPGGFDGTLDAFVDRVHPVDVSHVREQLDHAIETDSSYRAEFRMREADGETQWVEVRGRLVDGGDRMVGIHHDITERKARERRLSELKTQYQTLVDNFPDGAVFLFDHDCRYVRAGGEGLAAVGLSADDLVGSTPSDLFPDDIAAELVDASRGALAGHSDTFEQSYAGDRYRIRTVPVRSDDGDVAYGMAVSRNVTDEVRRRQELERQNDRLEAFASVVSHDLRNPLNVAQGRLELARAERDSEHLDTVATALDRSFELIDDLLTLAREGEEVEAREPVALDATARACWRTVETADATLAVRTDRTVRADPSRLQQLLENLFRNSVEHGSTGSRPKADDTVEHGSTSSRTESDDSMEHGSTTDRTDSDGTFTRGATDRPAPDDAADRPGPAVRITVGELPDGFYVEDDGPGIPAERRDRVFEAGYSTSDRGTGFGLSIVSEIADAHGWAIEATEGADGGARFEITGVDAE